MYINTEPDFEKTLNLARNLGKNFKEYSDDISLSPKTLFSNTPTRMKLINLKCETEPNELYFQNEDNLSVASSTKNYEIIKMNDLNFIQQNPKTRIIQTKVIRVPKVTNQINFPSSQGKRMPNNLAKKEIKYTNQTNQGTTTYVKKYSGFMERKNNSKTNFINKKNSKNEEQNNFKTNTNPNRLIIETDNYNTYQMSSGNLFPSNKNYSNMSITFNNRQKNNFPNKDNLSKNNISNYNTPQKFDYNTNDTTTTSSTYKKNSFYLNKNSGVNQDSNTHLSPKDSQKRKITYLNEENNNTTNKDKINQNFEKAIYKKKSKEKEEEKKPTASKTGMILALAGAINDNKLEKEPEDKKIYRIDKSQKNLNSRNYRYNVEKLIKIMISLIIKKLKKTKFLKVLKELANLSKGREILEKFYKRAYFKILISNMKKKIKTNKDNQKKEDKTENNKLSNQTKSHYTYISSNKNITSTRQNRFKRSDNNITSDKNKEKEEELLERNKELLKQLELIKKENSELKQNYLDFKDYKNKYDEVVKEKIEIQKKNKDIEEQNKELTTALKRHESKERIKNYVVQEQENIQVKRRNSSGYPSLQMERIPNSIPTGKKREIDKKKISQIPVPNKKGGDLSKEEIKKIKRVKDLFRNIEFEKKKFLHKNFLRFYYNGLYLRMSIPLSKKKTQNTQNDNNQTDNNNNQTDNKNNQTDNSEAISFNSKYNSLSEEEKNKLKKNKKLKDLFYKKVDQRKKLIIKYFMRFYYNGLLAITKKNKKEKKMVSFKTEKLIPKYKDDMAIPKSQEFTEKNDNTDKKKEEEEKEALRRRSKSRDLRRLISKRNKEKQEMLRKYFFKFQMAGLFSAIKKEIKKSSRVNSPRQSRDLTYCSSSSIFTSTNEEQKFERVKVDEKDEERNKLINSKLSAIVFKKDRILKKKLKSYFEQYNLRAKVLSLKPGAGIRRGSKKKKSSKSKAKKNNKKNNEVNNEEEQKEGEDNEESSKKNNLSVIKNVDEEK